MNTNPVFLPPSAVGADDGRCCSLKEITLNKEKRTVLVRCEATFGHPGKNHRSWFKKWTTDEEDGRLSR